MAAERLEEIHQYLRDRAARQDAIAQTKTRDGQELDWIPIESQTRDGRIASPPSEDRPDLGPQKKPTDGDDKGGYNRDVDGWVQYGGLISGGEAADAIVVARRWRAFRYAATC